MNVGISLFYLSSLSFLFIQRYCYKITKPKILYKKNDIINLKELINKCPSLHYFQANILLLLLLFDIHGTLQSFIPTLMRNIFKKKSKFNRELIELSDKSTIALDWLTNIDNNNNNKPIVILIHGLCGSTSSSYIQYSADIFIKQNYDVVSYVARGCSNVQLTTPMGFTAANYTDLLESIHYIHNKYPYRKCIFIII